MGGSRSSQDLKTPPPFAQCPPGSQGSCLSVRGQSLPTSFDHKSTYRVTYRVGSNGPPKCWSASGYTLLYESNTVASQRVACRRLLTSSRGVSATSAPPWSRPTPPRLASSVHRISVTFTLALRTRRRRYRYSSSQPPMRARTARNISDLIALSLVEPKLSQCWHMPLQRTS
jgi:hypothetical protein